MGQFNQLLESVGTFNPLTIKFLEILAENKRLTYISQICDKYVKYYKTLNKEEKIVIISSETLTSGEQGEVLSALKANPLNAGKEFTLEFTIDATIKGGL
jgi:F0F1-type ATP synthase delta subunit